MFKPHHTVALITHASKVIVKILKQGFGSMWTENFQMFKLDLERAKEPEIKLPTSTGSLKKQKSSRKNICFVDCPKAFDCVDHNNCGKFLKR